MWKRMGENRSGVTLLFWKGGRKDAEGLVSIEQLECWTNVVCIPPAKC